MKTIFKKRFTNNLFKIFFLILLPFFWGASTNNSAPNISVEGRVLDDNFNPLEGVQCKAFLVHSKNRVKCLGVVSSNLDGTFGFTLPQGQQINWLTFYSDKYYSILIPFLSGDDYQNLTVVMPQINGTSYSQIQIETIKRALVMNYSLERMEGEKSSADLLEKYRPQTAALNLSYEYPEEEYLSMFGD